MFSLASCNIYIKKDIVDNFYKLLILPQNTVLNLIENWEWWQHYMGFWQGNDWLDLGASYPISMCSPPIYCSPYLDLLTHLHSLASPRCLTLVISESFEVIWCRPWRLCRDNEEGSSWRIPGNAWRKFKEVEKSPEQWWENLGSAVS